jgi:hypothetical protein
VLKVNFSKHGSGTKKIEDGEFAIQDSVSKRDIDLTGDWETCFYPGQHVDMSIILIGIRLQLGLTSRLVCPRCQNDPEGGGEELDVVVEW